MITKKRGRPVTGQGVLIGVRLLPPNLSALDAWIADQPEPRPSRPEAIRFALREWLATIGGQGARPGREV
jgi:hypothetical protein